MTVITQNNTTLILQIQITLDEALARASTSLRQKMLHSVELLRKAERIARIYDPDDGFYLAFSGGKGYKRWYAEKFLEYSLDLDFGDDKTED